MTTNRALLDQPETWGARSRPEEYEEHELLYPPHPAVGAEEDCAVCQMMLRIRDAKLRVYQPEWWKFLEGALWGLVAAEVPPAELEERLQAIWLAWRTAEREPFAVRATTALEYEIAAAMEIDASAEGVFGPADEVTLARGDRWRVANEETGCPDITPLNEAAKARAKEARADAEGTKPYYYTGPAVSGWRGMRIVGTES